MLLETRCTVCHSRARIDDEDGDLEDWSEIVLRMESYGAQLSDDERQILVAYLVATHGEDEDDDHNGSDDDHSGKGRDDDDDD